MTEITGDALQKPESTEPACLTQVSEQVSPEGQQTAGASKITTLPDAAAGGARMSPHWRNLPTVLMAHRRQTAAAVLLICMAAVWVEEQPSAVSDSTTDPETEVTSVESLLRDFETVDSGALREPAEPADQAFGQFQMTVPSLPDRMTAESNGFSPSSSSTAVAVYPDEEAASNSSTGSFTIPNTTPQTTTASAQDFARRHSIRFTGRIQPIK